MVTISDKKLNECVIKSLFQCRKNIEKWGLQNIKTLGIVLGEEFGELCRGVNELDGRKERFKNKLEIIEYILSETIDNIAVLYAIYLVSSEIKKKLENDEEVVKMLYEGK